MNPQNTVPENGLYSAGISVPLGQGLFINQRMATLKKARIFQDLTVVQRNILINQILYDAAMAYFKWFKAHNEMRIYTNFLNNATIRFEGIRQQVRAGAVAGIDTVEAKITVQKPDAEPGAGTCPGCSKQNSKLPIFYGWTMYHWNFNPGLFPIRYCCKTLMKH